MRLARPQRPFAFAAGTQFIPAVADEFTAACRELPIVFMPGTTRPNAVFVVGLAAGENLLVRDDGEWDGTYIPAFVRRYPFIRGDVEGGEPIVCIDPTFEGFNEENGEAFFDGSSETGYLQAQVGLVNAYFESSRRSEEFCDVLNRMELLKSVTIDVRSPGNTLALHGLFTVDEEKLDKLPAKEFEKLRKAGYLPAIYAHLISLGGIQRLASRHEALRSKGMNA